MATEQKKQSPYKAHLFICINNRHGARRSCADGNSVEIAGLLKQEIKNRRYPPTDVRVSKSLCMGLCEHGPNVIIYPQKIWYSHVTPEDVGRIADQVGDIISQHGRD